MLSFSHGIHHRIDITVRWLTLRPRGRTYPPAMPHTLLIVAGAVFVLVVVLALTYRGT